jgi:hypothetical protein
MEWHQTSKTNAKVKVEKAGTEPPIQDTFQRRDEGILVRTRKKRESVGGEYGAKIVGRINRMETNAHPRSETVPISASPAHQ